MTALLNAALGQDIRWMQRILKERPKCDVNAPNHIGCTALMVAAQRNNHQITQLLLKSGADPNLHCYLLGGSPLHYAAKKAQPENIKLLFAHGANVNSRSRSDETPLFWVNQFGANVADAVSLLVSLGAEVDATDPQGRTALDRAVLSGQEACAVALIKSGANVHRKRIVRADVSVPLYEALLNRDTNMVRILLEHGALVNETVESGGKVYKMLHSATWLNFSKGVRLLLQYGDKSAAVADAQGHTPFDIALNNSYSDIVLQLKESIEKQSQMALVDLCILLRPIGLPVLVVLEIFKQQNTMFKNFDPDCTISLSKQWTIAADMKR